MRCGGRESFARDCKKWQNKRLQEITIHIPVGIFDYAYGRNLVKLGTIINVNIGDIVIYRKYWFHITR